MRFLRVAWLVFSLALVALAASGALARPSKLAPRGRAYAARHNLPVREFRHDLGDRQVDRMFVPVLPGTVADFTAEFSAENQALVWRASPYDLVHGVVSLRPRQAIQHNQQYGDLTDQAHIIDPTNGGHYVTFSLSQAQYGHWDKLMARFARGTDLYSGLYNFQDDRRARGEDCHGGCMWWVVHGEVAPDLNLAHHLGVQRAKGPEVLFPRAIHAGNDNVGPIGVGVRTVAEFEAMSEAQLFGAEPAGGAAARVHMRPGEQRERPAPARALRRPANENAAAGGPEVVTAREAARLMGGHVFMATGSAAPSTLASAMKDEAMRRPAKTDVYYMSTFAPAAHFTPATAAKWHPNLFFLSRQNQDAAVQGHATLHRASLFTLSKQIRSGKHPIDTVVVRVSPPDADGMVSLGTAGDLTLAAVDRVLKKGGRIIAEVNENVPRSFGNRIPYARLAAVVEDHTMLAEAPARLAPGPAERALAKHIAALVPDRGATLQVGIGNSLTGVGDALTRKRDLKIWSELGSDWAIPLIGGPRPVVKDAVFSFLHGSNALYRIANDNQRIRLAGTREVNDPKKIAAQPNMRSINTALEVDLAGNVNAERIGPRMISFPGGQPDFMAGAARSPDGRAILALRSLNKDAASTIVFTLNGDVITTPARHVDHVVTEWGATPLLRGLSRPDRTRALIEIAHPVHREALARTAFARGVIRKTDVERIVAGVRGAVVRAPKELRRAAADLALERGVIGAADHARAVRGLAVAARE